MIRGVVDDRHHLAEAVPQLVRVPDERSVVGLAGRHVTRLPVQRDAAVNGLAPVAERHWYGFGGSAEVGRAGAENVRVLVAFVRHQEDKTVVFERFDLLFGIFLLGFELLLGGTRSDIRRVFLTTKSSS